MDAAHWWWLRRFPLPYVKVLKKVEMILFRTRNGSIPRFKYIYRTIFLVKGSIGQVWNHRVLYRTQRNPVFKSV